MPIFLAILLFLLPFYPSLVSAQSDPKIAKQFSELQAEIKSMRRDVSEIKDAVTLIMEIFEQSAQRKMPISDISFQSDKSSQDDFVLGKADAPVSMMVFSDYQCGFCARFHNTAFPKLVREFVDSGKLKIIFRDYPLTMHPQAALAASYAACAGAQGKFMEMHDALFAMPDNLAQGDYKSIAASVPELDHKKLELCLQSPEYAVQESDQGYTPSKEAMADLAEAQKLKLISTPSFFVGKSRPAGSEMKGVYMRGALEFSAFKEVIDQVLAEKA